MYREHLYFRKMVPPYIKRLYALCTKTKHPFSVLSCSNALRARFFFCLKEFSISANGKGNYESCKCFIELYVRKKCWNFTKEKLHL